MKNIAALVIPLVLASCSSEVRSASVSSAPARDGWPAAETAWPGFTLVAPLQTTDVYLVDMAGNPVHSWETEGKPGVAMYLTERGTLLKCNRVLDHPTFDEAGGNGGWIQELDWNGDVLWDFRWLSEDGTNHHDVEELPNGNILIIAWDRTTREVALAAGRDPELLEGEEFWGGAIYEIKPTRPKGGEVVWSWHAMDHVTQNIDPALPNFHEPWEYPNRIDINGDRDPLDEEEDDDQAAQMAAIGYGGGDDTEDEEEEDPVKAAHKARVKDADWLHTNAIDYNAELDQIVISVRRYDEVWIIDHSITTEEAAGRKGDLLYRWGNPHTYGMGRWEDRQLLGQHNIQWIPDNCLGGGNFIVFNNGAKPREWSSADEWHAPRDAEGNYPREEDQPWGPKELEWSYAAEEASDFFSPFISGVQRLPNGNTLICSGADGRVFEVNTLGKILWDWRSPFLPDENEKEDSMKKFPTAIFRAARYGSNHPGVVKLRERGAPIPLDPGTGPVTNQYVPPPAEEEEREEK